MMQQNWMVEGAEHAERSLLHFLLGMSAGSWKGLPHVRISLIGFQFKKCIHLFSACNFAFEHFKHTR